MSERIHPHWIETEGGQPVKVRAAKKQQTVWRWPAALVGIFVVGTIIAAPFINFSTLFGQVAPVSGVVEVRIRNGQFVPEFITVQQGEQVTWFNDDDTPHSIESDTLCNSQNACLVTPTILRGESTFLLVPDDVSSGEYTYTSSTNPTMIGRINIEESALTFDTPLTEVASAPIETASPLPSSTSNENSIPEFAAETQRPSASAPPGGSIVRNPYTIGSARIHPYDEFGNPKTSATVQNEQLRAAATSEPVPVPISPSQTVQNPLLPEARNAIPSQPESGPNDWFVMLLFSGVLGFTIAFMTGGVRVVIQK